MRNQCNLFYADTTAANFLIKYRGDFLEQMSKVSYACGTVIIDTIGIIAVTYENLDRLIKDVPAISYVDIRAEFVLQDLSPSYADNINNIKLNPYLNLTGRNVIVGIIDTGINYLNDEFINEDGTSRILSIWDQSIPYDSNKEDSIIENQNISPLVSSENTTIENTTSKSTLIPLDLINKKVPQSIFDNVFSSTFQSPSESDSSKDADEDFSNIKDLNKLYNNLYIGTVYSKENINDAIKAFEKKEDPYAIVPSKDTIGHGTKVASIIAARGKNLDLQGVANGSDLVIVKLFESLNLKKVAESNNIVPPPIYNNSELVSALEFLKSEFIRLNRPMVIYIGIGSTYGSHDGINLTSRYITNLGNTKGLCIVSGVGNEGNAQGHVTGIIRNVGDLSTQELRVPKELKLFSFNIWIQRPNKASIAIISPSGESTKIITSKSNKSESYNFVFTNTKVIVEYFTPEHFTGHELINVAFFNIKPGIWRIELLGVYIVGGRYDIWLPP
uniref:S8 family peptidase n=1 Tax=Clostridium sp. TaxID=1506 RepID=UPI002608407B